MKKLLEFQKKVGAITKDGKNPHFKSTYATLTQILSEVKPILTELGLVLSQPIINGSVCTRITDNEQVIAESSIKLPDNLSPQQTGSAITYFRRYTLASLLALEIEEDDDGNSAQNELKPFLNQGSAIYRQAVKFLSEGGKMEQIKMKYTMSEATEIQLKTDAGI